MKKKKTLAGLIDKSGVFVLPPSWTQLRSYSNERLPYKKSNKWGILNRSGEVVKSHTYESIGIFENSIAPFRSHHLWGYLDLDGNELLSPKYDFARPFSNGFAAVAKAPNGTPKDQIFESSPILKWGLINIRGELVVDYQFDYVHDLKEKYFVGIKKTSAGLFDLTGKTVATLPTNRNFNMDHIRLIGSFVEGLIAMPQKYQEKFFFHPFGYLNESMKMQIEPMFLHANDFSEGLASATQQGSWRTTLHNTCYGFIDKKGQWSIEPQFPQAGNFSEGFCAVKDKASNLWGYIDKNGNFVIQPKFSTASEFKDGAAVVSVEVE